MIENKLKALEEYAFYESGLSAHGCLDGLDDYAKEAIKKYGRVLVRLLERELDACTKTFPEIYMDPAAPTHEVQQEVKDIAKRLYGVVLNVHELAKQYPLIAIGPSLYDEAYRSIKKYEECNHLNGRI